MTLLKFVEGQAEKNAAFHIACAEALAKESNVLLTILLAGAGASFWYAIKLIETSAQSWLSAGLSTLSVYLFLLSGLVTWKCLWSREMFPPANEPKNLHKPEHELEDIRRVELKNRQACIDFNRDRNDAVGLWLNRCRIAAAFTPAVFAVAALVVGL